jgi:hypothetical protein
MTADFDTSPQRAYVLVGKFEADTREGLSLKVQEFADAIAAGSCPGRSIGGGATDSHIIELRVNEAMTHDEYFRQLEAYLDGKREAKCDPTRTECPRCKNDIAKCDGTFAGGRIPLADLNRRVVVEQRLLDAYHGKAPLPTREECLDLAKTLGVPDEHRNEAAHQWLLRGIERLMRDDPAADSPRGRLLSAVADAVEQYEKAIYG